MQYEKYDVNERTQETEEYYPIRTLSSKNHIKSLKPRPKSSKVEK